MNTVGKQAEGVGGEAVEGLDDHECEVQAGNWLAHELLNEERRCLLDEVKDSARVFFKEDGLQQRPILRPIQQELCSS